VKVDVAITGRSGGRSREQDDFGQKIKWRTASTL
jgi:hypothetical protein